MLIAGNWKMFKGPVEAADFCRALRNTHLPDGVDLVDAAAVPLIALTGDQLVRHAAKLQKGQTILVTEQWGAWGELRCILRRRWVRR